MSVLSGRFIALYWVGVALANSLFGKAEFGSAIDAVVFVLISCTNSKEEPIDSIVGLWKLKSITMTEQEFINACKSKDQVEVRSYKTFTILLHSEVRNCSE